MWLYGLPPQVRTIILLLVTEVKAIFTGFAHGRFQSGAK